MRESSWITDVCVVVVSQNANKGILLRNIGIAGNIGVHPEAKCGEIKEISHVLHGPENIF